MPSPRSKILSPEQARTAGYALASLSALVVVTCAGAARGPVGSAGNEKGIPKATPSSVAATPSAAPPLASATASPSTAKVGAFSQFRAALSELASGKRTNSVRVLWLGDSHAAADFWPDAVRKPLMAKYGSGGPGFLYVGLPVYRHSGVKITRDGRFRMEPKQPSLWTRQADGVFGLGGIRTVPEADSSRVAFELGKDAVANEAHWVLGFRLPTNKAHFRVSIASGQSFVVDAATQAVGTVSHFDWTTAPGSTVTISDSSGEPEFFGVTIEDKKPGVVVDTLGINGARIGTPLAWDEAAWVTEAARRDASLFVLAYGTNEISDEVAVRRYEPELESLVLRVRKAAPHADCLVVGPTDRAGPGWVPLPRAVEIDETLHGASSRLGCSYFSTIDAMGGSGSIREWAKQEPPLAAPDKVHLTPRGYGTLGAKMASDLFGL